jgi:hypothetical protein
MHAKPKNLERGLTASPSGGVMPQIPVKANGFFRRAERR